MAHNRALRLLPIFAYFLVAVVQAQSPVQVTPPASPPSDNVNIVYSNFYGVSLELSFIDLYIGNDTNSIPQAVLNYLTAMHSRTSGSPVRLRLGGNSMDSSTYVPSQQQIIQFTDPNANVNDQPVNYGGQMFNIMKTVSDKIGVQWLIGLSLRDPNNTNIPLAASDANKILGDDLDAYLLGNEPDLYLSHGNRPGYQNYTTNDYIGDYWVTFNNLQHSPSGDVLSTDKIAGPTICCFWDLLPVLQSGWLQDFSDRLKYITVQHYPQNNCFGSYDLHLDYYMSHANTVGLAAWQQNGLDYVNSLPAGQRKPVLMDEFNSASCGGIPESDMFGIGLWSADYALRMAVVGYSAAYLHTREWNVTYNVWNPPTTAGGAWTTNTNFYAMLAVTEALQSPNGNRVVDLNLANSTTDSAATVAGYAVYDAAQAGTVRSVVLFNYANSSTPAEFALPAAFFAGAQGSGSVLVRYMYAPSATETTAVNWGNLTYAGVGDGQAVQAQNLTWGERTVSCTGGCTVQVPGPAMAVVFAAGVPDTTGANGSANGTTGGANGTATHQGNGSGSPSPSASGKADSANSGASAGAGLGANSAVALLTLLTFGAMFL